MGRGRDDAKVSGWWSSHLKIIAVSVGECDLRGPLGRMMVGNDYSTVVQNINWSIYSYCGKGWLDAGLTIEGTAVKYSFVR
jgi:hypothetical protein